MRSGSQCKCEKCGSIFCDDRWFPYHPKAIAPFWDHIGNVSIIDAHDLPLKWRLNKSVCEMLQMLVAVSNDSLQRARENGFIPN